MSFRVTLKSIFMKILPFVARAVVLFYLCDVFLFGVVF